MPNKLRRYHVYKLDEPDMNAALKGFMAPKHAGTVEAGNETIAQDKAERLYHTRNLFVSATRLTEEEQRKWVLKKQGENDNVKQGASG